MSLSDFATLSTAISGLAVTASLIYLALQTHQATKHTKALIHQGNAARITGMASLFANADMVAAIIVGNGGTPSAEEVQRRQFGYWCMALVVSMEDTFGQHEEGLISEDRFNSFRAGVAGGFMQPGMRRYWAAWKAARPNAQESFKAWVDEIIASQAGQISTTPHERSFSAQSGQ